MQEEADLFKALSDPTRLRLAVLLATHGEVCVCVMAEALAEPDFKISRHLRVMLAAGIVKSRREGTWMHYRLAEPRDALEAALQGCLRDALSGHETAVADAGRLAPTSCGRQATQCGASAVAAAGG